MNYTDLGMAAHLRGKVKVGDREAYVIDFDPASGSLVRQFIDAETYLQAKASLAVQNDTIVVSRVEHNVPVDDALFVKPATGEPPSGLACLADFGIRDGDGFGPRLVGPAGHVGDRGIEAPVRNRCIRASSSSSACSRR